MYPLSHSLQTLTKQYSVQHRDPHPQLQPLLRRLERPSNKHAHKPLPQYIHLQPQHNQHLWLRLRLPSCRFIRLRHQSRLLRLLPLLLSRYAPVPNWFSNLLKCYIEGAVDFIFGQHARTWITNSTIAVSAGGGCITANGRADENDESYFVINECEVVAAEGADVEEGTVYLGRPWSEYSRVDFQDSNLGAIVDGEGWKVWSDSDPWTGHVTFQEFGNVGEGAEGERVSFAVELKEAADISTVLGSDYGDWVDLRYLA